MRSKLNIIGDPDSSFLVSDEAFGSKQLKQVAESTTIVLQRYKNRHDYATNMRRRPLLLRTSKLGGAVLVSHLCV